MRKLTGDIQGQAQMESKMMTSILRSSAVFSMMEKTDTRRPDIHKTDVGVGGELCLDRRLRKSTYTISLLA